MKDHLKKILFYIGSLIPHCLILSDIRNILYSGYISTLISVVDKQSFSCEFPVYISKEKNILIKSGHLRKNSRISAISKYNNTIYHPHITIGKNFNLEINSHIGAINEIIIGDNFLTGANCLITDHTHGYFSFEELDIPPNDKDLYSKGPVHIGNNVFMGENAIIISCLIGDNVIIGASSVVTKDLPSNCMAAGNPAKIIKYIC